MKKQFENHLQAIDWIADHAETESHFEILREELTFNHIYTGEYFIDTLLSDREVAWIEVDLLDHVGADRCFDIGEVVVYRLARQRCPVGDGRYGNLGHAAFFHERDRRVDDAAASGLMVLAPVRGRPRVGLRRSPVI